MDAYKSAGTILASAARTTAAQGTSEEQITEHERGVNLFVTITANPGGAETLTPQIQIKDPISGNYVNYTAFAAITAATNGTFVYTLYPGGAETAATAAHEVQALPLPRHWRVVVTPSASGSFTYSVGFSTLV